MRAVSQEIARIWSVARAYAQWLLSPRLVWVTATVFAVVLTYAFWRPVTEARIAHAGVILQLVGTSMGIWALRATRKLFKLLSLTDEARAWIRRRPRNITMQLSGGAFSVSGGSARMSVWSAMGSDLDATRRMDAMAANIEQLRKEADEARAEHTAATAKLRTDMESKTRAIEDGLSGTTLTLHESQTGGLWMAVVALIILLVGTVLAGFPDLFVRLVYTQCGTFDWLAPVTASSLSDSVSMPFFAAVARDSNVLGRSLSSNDPVREFRRPATFCRLPFIASRCSADASCASLTRSSSL